MYVYIYIMITENQRSDRLRRLRALKVRYVVKLEEAGTAPEKRHYEARIAEVVSNIKATEPPKPKALLPAMTKTAEDAAKKAEEHIVQPMKPERPALKRTLKKVKKVGNPF